MRSNRLIPLLIVMAGCVPATPRPVAMRVPLPAPVTPPTAPAPPAPAADWRDGPITPGTWRYARDDRTGSSAAFAVAGMEPVAVVRCDLPNRRIFLSRSGQTPSPMTVRTSSTTRVLPAGATGGAPPYVAAVLPATDPLFDAIAFSRGRFVLEQNGMPPMALPTWAEVARVIEDCR